MSRTFKKIRGERRKLRDIDTSEIARRRHNRRQRKIAKTKLDRISRDYIEDVYDA